MSTKVYDSAFRTMAQKMPGLMVPLINEVFGRSYKESDLTRQLRNDYVSKGRETIADFIFELGGRVYHVECESGEDPAIPIRMLEYDARIAYDTRRRRDGVWSVELPESCVVFLRGTPEQHEGARMSVDVSLPDGQRVTYRPRVVSASSYGLEEIFEKRLLVLLPFYIMRFEEMNRRDYISELLAACSRMALRLSVLVSSGEMTGPERDEILDLCAAVSDFLLRDDAATARKARDAMGGEVFELVSERMERIGREAAEQGLAQGVEQERARAIAEVDAAFSGEPADNRGEVFELVSERMERTAREAAEQGIEQERARIIGELRAAGADEALIARVSAV